VERKSENREKIKRLRGTWATLGFSPGYGLCLATSSTGLQVANRLVLAHPQGRREEVSWAVGWCWACEWESRARFGLLLGRPTLLG
jgi:hypothetical protein